MNELPCIFPEDKAWAANFPSLTRSFQLAADATPDEEYYAFAGLAVDFTSEPSMGDVNASGAARTPK